MKAVVIGSGGQLGQCIISQVRKKNLSKNFIFYSRSKLDISNHNKVRETINSIIPNIIINASGYTDVDEAENNKIEALAFKPVFNSKDKILEIFHSLINQKFKIFLRN